MDNGLTKYIKENPLRFIFLVILYTIGASSFANLKIFQDTRTTKLLTYVILKGVTIIFPLYLCKYVSPKKTNVSINIFSFICIILFFAVCINNFPIISLLNKKSKLILKWDILLYLVACFEIAVFEEIVFRYIIFNVLLNHFNFKNYFWLIMINSVIFSLCHLVNAFSLNIGALFMQLGYSFLLGALCSFAYILTKSVLIPIILHFIYDVGGMLTNYDYVLGNIWDIKTIIITAVLGVVTTGYAIFVYFKYYKENLNEISSSES